MILKAGHQAIAIGGELGEAVSLDWSRWGVVDSWRVQLEHATFGSEICGRSGELSGGGHGPTAGLPD